MASKKSPKAAAASTGSAAQASSPLATALRTVTCGELTAADAGRRVVLTGWVARRRDYGQLIFIDLRDRYGVTQVVFDPDRYPGIRCRTCRSRRRRGWNMCCASRGWWPSAWRARRIPPSRPARSRWRRKPSRCSIPSKVPPFPIADRVSADESAASALPLSRYAPRHHAREGRAAPPRRQVHPRLHG